MKRFIFLSLVVSIITSCVSYYNIKGNDPNLNSTIAQRIQNLPGNYAKGKSCVRNFLGLVAIGDSSLDAAIKNGNLENITYSYTSYKRIRLYYRIYQEGCTIVLGN